MKTVTKDPVSREELNPILREIQDATMFRDLTFKSSDGSEIAVAHGFNQVPRAWTVIDTDKFVKVRRGKATSKTHLYLHTDKGGANVTIRVFL